MNVQRMLALFGAKITTFTDALSMSIDQELERGNDISRNVNELWERTVEFLKENQKLNRVGRRVRNLHEAVDHHVAFDLDRTVSCKKGCNNCCHLNVVVTDDEAEILAKLYDGTQDEKLKRQAAVTDDLRYPRILGYKDAACVFLKDGECSIYEHRPIACRAYHVVTDPDRCDAIKYPDEMVGQVAHTRAEIIKSVVYSMYGCSRLATALLKKRS